MLPNASSACAEMRSVSTLGRSRALCVESEILFAAPARPLAWNFTGVETPFTLAVTSLSPTIVPSVHADVAWPFESVTATRGFVTPLPSVTANATVAPCTGRPEASLTRTTSPPLICDPTDALRDRSEIASILAGGLVDGASASPPPQAAVAPTMASEHHRKNEREIIAKNENG